MRRTNNLDGEGEIKEKTNKVGILGGGGGGSNRVHPISYLMEEMWEMILSFVEDSKSVHSMFLAYPPFGTTFKKKIQLWYFDQIFPHLFLYLDKKDVRNCVHVCKTWRRVIFKFVDDHPSRRPYNEELGRTSFTTPRSTLIYNLKSLIVTFDSPHSISRFLHIKPNHLNPFIGRSVVLDTDPLTVEREDLHHFQNYSKSLLEEYGKHIYYFEMANFFGEHDESAIEFQQRLAFNLSFLPNLRYLQVYTQQDSNALTEESMKSLPPLPNLESLKLTRLGGSAMHVIIALMRSYVNDQLRYLSLPLEYWNQEFLQFSTTSVNSDNNINKISLKGLTELRVVVRDAWDLEKFSNLISHLSMDKLQKIEFVDRFNSQFGHHRVPARIPEEFLQSLYGFQIRVLELSCAPPHAWGSYCNRQCETSGNCTTWQNVIISLPNVHTLRIRNAHENTSYKFLSKIPSLQNLEIRAREEDDQEILTQMDLDGRNRPLKPRVKQGYGCHYDQITRELNMWIFYQEPTMDNSLIWNLLPGLKTLKITFEFWERIINSQSSFQIATRVNTFRRNQFVRKQKNV